MYNFECFGDASLLVPHWDVLSIAWKCSKYRFWVCSNDLILRTSPLWRFSVFFPNDVLSICPSLYTTPHHTTLQYPQLQLQLRFLTLHYTTLHYIAVHSLHHHKRNCSYTTLITLHHNYNILQLHYTTTTAALHHTTSSSCGWGDRPGDHCNH